MDWTLAYIVAVYVKALDFTLSISSFACSARFDNFLQMCLAKQMPSYMITN